MAMLEFITMAPALGRRQSILVEAAFRLSYSDIVRRVPRRLSRMTQGVGNTTDKGLKEVLLQSIIRKE